MQTSATLKKMTSLLGSASILAGCTGQLPGSFRLSQLEQNFKTSQELNTKIDLLWVVDNSASMDVSQRKLRDGFSAFAAKYLQPTWDIRVAVITTDTYLAHPAFANYLTTTVPNTVGWTSPTIAARLATFQNPAANPTLVNLSTGRFDSGVRYGDLVPLWGPQYSRLLPGLHDGPITGLCFEALPYFLRGVSQCGLRDAAAAARGVENCLNPGVGQDSLSQCVNTTQNDTVRSGKALLETRPSSGVAANTQQLARDFMVNVTTGSTGHGSERGIASVLQLLSDNENTATAFFRAGSIRAIIFVSDEDDQSFSIDWPTGGSIRPIDGYRCDQAGLLASNPASRITGASGACCSTPGQCTYGSEGTSCSPKTVDGYTYTLSVCARSELLTPVDDAKTMLDQFFRELDGARADSTVEPNYFVTSIVPLSGSSIQALQLARSSEDSLVGAITSVAVDRGDRYLALGAAVGNGSMEMDIASSDYTPVLEAIGRAVIEKRTTFLLDRAPTSVEDMILTLVHADGTSEVIPSSKIEISGKTVRISDLDFALSLSATDRISVNYQPKTLY